MKYVLALAVYFVGCAGVIGVAALAGVESYDLVGVAILTPLVALVAVAFAIVAISEDGGS